ncbi:MAG: alpha-L-fucosidase [Ruminococcaceae bacterium]|nr:alpha-L-fucosidase [Oscillospiraceae bacterium]
MNKKWFKEAGFGMMIHWGLYSLLGGEWQGKRMEYIGEWIMSGFRIPNKEYEKLADVFNPIYFDAEEWVHTAKAAGMKYIVVTAKHHDGFALFHSKADKYNIVDATPFGRDVIRELADACAKNDMKLGLYYSQVIDWHENHGGGYDMKFYHTNRGGMSWDNDWDFPDRDKKDYRICYEKKIKPQVEELLTNYGDLCLIWFDTPLDIPEQCSRELFDMVKKYQPNCLVNSRIGNGMGDYRSCGDNKLPEEYSDELVEAPVTLNHTWGYKAFDNDWKSPEKVREILCRCRSCGANLLLNIGPDHLGRLPAPAVEILNSLNGI